MLFLLASFASIALFAARADLHAQEANRQLERRNALFAEWTRVFKRIEERQAQFLTTVKSDLTPEQWARIEELNREAGLAPPRK